MELSDRVQGPNARKNCVEVALNLTAADASRRSSLVNGPDRSAALRPGRILEAPPRSAASGRPLRSWKAPPTRSLERLRSVAHAFQRAGSGGFLAARWWYVQDAP